MVVDGARPGRDKVDDLCILTWEFGAGVWISPRNGSSSTRNDGMDLQLAANSKAMSVRRMALQRARGEAGSRAQCTEVGCWPQGDKADKQVLVC